MPKTKKQHYVPQLSLRRFSSDAEHVYVFDKIRNEVRKANIRDIAQQRYFYDIPEEAIPAEFVGVLDRQMLERRLSALETRFNTVVARVIDRAQHRSVRRRLRALLPRGNKVISRNIKRALCFFVALQYLRTREFRLTIQDGVEQFEAAIGRMLPKDLPKEFVRGFERPGDANIRMLHLSLMFDRAFVDSLTRLMYQHILVIGRLRGGQTLYTSDNPMVRQPHRIHPFLGNAGVGSPGIEIAMPISSSHVIVLMERTHFGRLAKSDRTVVDLEAGNVEYYNSLQVKNCERQTYCAEDDFDLARDFCRRWPERCAEERGRIIVE